MKLGKGLDKSIERGFRKNNLSGSILRGRGVLHIKLLKHTNFLAIAVIILAIILALNLVFQRIIIEKNYDNVEIMVGFSEVESLANANGLELNDLALKLKDKGVTSVLVKEISLGDLQRTGQISFSLGEEVKLAQFYNKLNPNIPLANSNLIISIYNKEMENQIYEHLKQKLPSIKYYPSEISALVLNINLPNSDGEKTAIYDKLKSIGIGFDHSKLKIITDLNLKIIPQVKEWDNSTINSLKFVANELKKVPNLNTIMFNDSFVPGYPNNLEILANELKKINTNISVGIVEFFNQKGLDRLAVALNKNAVRVHSISSNELGNYSSEEAIARYKLAVNERNVRTLLIRFLNMDQPANVLEKNLDYISTLKIALVKEGYNIGSVDQFSSPIYSTITIFFIGLGVIMGGVLILNKKKWGFLSLVFLMLATFIWALLLFKQQLLARKLMSLVSVIVFPTLSFLVIDLQKKRTLFNSIVALIKLSSISLFGALLMIGLLGDKTFMLKIDQFIGVKAAHILPLILIPLLLFIMKENPLQNAKKIFNKYVTYKFIIFSGVILVALAIYVLRTGNVSSAFVSNFEQQIREGLQILLEVRPRTKEFLIGHPLALLSVYFGISRKNWYFILPAIIGQVSIVNTYAHIYTPLKFSFIRTLNGLWLGILIGVILIFSLKFVKNLFKESNL